MSLNSTTGDLANFLQIKKSCESLVSKTQADLENFKNEQDLLRAELTAILKEKTCVMTKLDEVNITSSISSPSESKDDATRARLCGHVEIKLKKQIDYLTAENHELHSLNKSSKKTIQNLECEIQNYRNQLFKPSTISEVKKKYNTAIKLLESTINTQKTELAQQAQDLRTLLDQKHQFRQHVAALETALSEKKRVAKETAYNKETVAKLELQLQKSTRQCKDLQKTLHHSKLIIEERLDRENCALQKVQEALGIAEAAVADKEEAMKREQIIKEECDHLAYTIGQVMDEAAERVEKDMEILRQKLSDKEKIILDQEQKLMDQIKNQKELNETWDTRCKRFEHKYKEVCIENKKLRERVHVATNALDELELKFQANSHQLKVDQSALRRAEEQEQQIQKYLETNMEVKNKYRAIIDDLTNKFEKEIKRLESNNAVLRSENTNLRLHNHVS